MMAIAAACPEGVQWLIVGGPARGTGGALHGAEGAPVETAQFTRMRLTLGEEAHAQTTPAPVRQHHRFGAVEDPRSIPARRKERLLEFRGFVSQRQRRGGADHTPLVTHQHAQAVVAAHVGIEVLGLVIEAAVVEVGKLAEDHYPQVRQVFDVGRYLWPPEQFDIHLESLASSRVTPAAMPARKRELIMRANPPLTTLRK